MNALAYQDGMSQKIEIIHQRNIKCRVYKDSNIRISMTLRILCTGDFQLDKTFGTLGEHAKNFRDQLMDTFTKVIQNYGSKHDLILIAGDLFDRNATPTPIIQKAAKILASCSTPCLIIPGNHDPVNSGIPVVLQEALSQLGADHVQVAVKREPVPYPDLGVTMFPAPLFRKDDISDQWGWIPERTKSQGTRIALMHGALDSLPGGLIPENLASQKDLDLVICGDQHGPSDGDAAASGLFNLETSMKRKLYYAMAPEAQHINQNFTGSFLSLDIDKNGKVGSCERIEVGEIRFVNETFDFDQEMEDSQSVLASVLEQTVERPPELTSIRLHLKGQLRSEALTTLNQTFDSLKQDWHIIEITNQVSEFEPEEAVADDNPLIAKISQVVDGDSSISSEMKTKITELLKLNFGRWQ